MRTIIAILLTIGVLSAQVPKEGFDAEVKGEFKVAAEHYEKHLDSKPDDRETAFRLVDIYNTQKLYKKSLVVLEKLIVHHPKDDIIMIKISQVHAVMDNPEKAILWCENALKIKPDSLEYLKSLFVLTRWNKDYGKMRSTAKAILKQDKNHREANMAIIKITVEGELVEEIDALAEYVAAFPDDVKARVAYARNLSWIGNYRKSLEVLDDAPNPDNISLLEQKARILAWSGYRERSLGIIKGLGGSSENYHREFTEAVANRTAGYTHDASESLEQLFRLGGPGPEKKFLEKLINLDRYSGPDFSFTWSQDSDELRKLTTQAGYKWSVNDNFSLKLSNEYSWLKAKRGSGLEQIDGFRDIDMKTVTLSTDWQPVRQLRLEAEAGYSWLWDTETPVYAFMSRWRVNDKLTLNAGHSREFFDVSPRSLSLGINKKRYEVGLVTHYSLQKFLYLQGGYDDLSDGNARWFANLNHFFPIYNSKDLNLHLGQTATFFGYENDFDHGYYDPDLYQKYRIYLSGYKKFSYNSGLLFSIAGGFHRDENQGFEPGGDINLEYTYGIHDALMFKIRGGYSMWYQPSGNYNSLIVQFEIVYRM